MTGRAGNRRDSKHRVLRRGESIRADGKYQFKYHINGKPHFVYSWRLEPTDKLPVGKKPCLSLRELEKQIGYDLDTQVDPIGKNITVEELVQRYLMTKTGVKHSTRTNYNFVQNLLKKEPFNSRMGEAAARLKRCVGFSGRLFRWRWTMMCFIKILLPLNWRR